MKRKEKIELSIITVNYHVKKELFACLTSILKAEIKNAYEIIVVDNDEIKTIKRDLKKKFPRVKYIPNENKGFGEGNNAGIRHANGKYLLFLNPDTKVDPGSITLLLEYLKKHTDVGIIAPLLYDKEQKLYPQGAKELTPIASVFTGSLIHRLFPDNYFAKKYWMIDEWDKTTTKEVASVPGAAMLMRKEVFENVKGFDEKFFLFFEEIDLCKRVRALNLKILIHPPAKMFHALGSSTKKTAKILNIFQQSRYYFFKKHYGLLSAIITESIMRINKYTAVIAAILIHALFISSYNIDSSMIFIGDQAWYYLSARDVILNNSFPLVGIPSSHPWLHQGAYWTYLLVPVLSLFRFDPVGGAYLSIGIHMLTVVLLYIVTKRLFSLPTALIATVLYASSPLILLDVRMPYHTTPIPILSLLYYLVLYFWTSGRPYAFPIIVFLLAVLYNFEIATFLLSITLFLVIVFGLFTHASWLRKTMTKHIFILSLTAFILPMLPMIIYDIGHGFPQTAKFLAWVGYKILVVFGYPPLKPEIKELGYFPLLGFFAGAYNKVIYGPSALVSFTIALFSIGYFARNILFQVRNRTYYPSVLLLALIILVSVVGIFATRTASYAYLPLLYPFIIILTAVFFARLMQKGKYTSIVVIFIIAIMAIANSYYLVQQNYFTVKGLLYGDRVAAVKKIIRDADKKSYNLQGTGVGSVHESFLMNYQYLAWLYGNEPVRQIVPLRYTIEETPQGIRVTRENKLL